MPLIGDVKVNRNTHPLGTPLREIWDFEMWDGQKWMPAATAGDIIYRVGIGGGSLAKVFE